MADEDLERYETDVELRIYKEYRDVLPMFKYVVETERRFYLANGVELHTRRANGRRVFSNSSSKTPGYGTCTALPAS